MIHHRKFLSTLSLRRATPAEHHANSQQEFLSTLSLRRATSSSYSAYLEEGISIHALLAESDLNYFDFSRFWCDFYPRSPCGERLIREPATGREDKFLSTLSLRRATPTASRRKTTNMNFYPRSPCGERRLAMAIVYSGVVISIHALLAESDTVTARIIDPTYDFYPRSPCGERRHGRHSPYLARRFLSTLSLRRAT